VVEQTFVMIKPDAVARRLVGTVIGRYEAKGLALVAMKLQTVSRELAERHYAEHRGKAFYEKLVSFITSGPSVQMVWEGENAVEVVRKLNGATDCLQADVGTIRGDLGLSLTQNLVHGSDSGETARREIEVYFGGDEVVVNEMPDARHLRR